MNWKLIKKDSSKQPIHGVYSDWKEQIAEECHYQCVYCSIHEAQFGGINNYHIDHFRPKSIFPLLENDICNLFYSCPICNRFKSNDWPASPDLNKVSYPDPLKVDYSEIFDLNSNYELIGKYIASEYIVVRLYLNRAQLVLERREEKKRNEVEKLISEITGLIENINENDKNELNNYIYDINRIIVNLLKLKDKRGKIRPYKLKDIRKP